jgi:membrane-associated phospholipid phosphatase
VSLQERYRRAVPYILGVYVVAVAVAFLYFNMRLTVEWVAIVLFGAAILSGRALLFVKDWGVFILVLLTWQLASPLAVRFGFPEHLTPLIDADRLVFFGNVPAVWLQQHLYQPSKLQLWDVLAASVYMLHFLTPLLAAFVLWMTNRELFAKFAIAFVVVAVAGWTTYVLYPAVPPWMAAEKLVHIHGKYLSTHDWRQLRDLGITNPYWYVQHHGRIYLHGAQNIFQAIMSHWYSSYNGTIFFAGLHMNYDQVGAMPSEHAAYPMLFFLFLRRQFGRIAYLALGYIALLVFSIMYLGQHYFIDAVVGFAYAGAAYALVLHVAPALITRLRARERVPVPAYASRTAADEV